MRGHRTRTSEPERLIAGDQLDVDADVPEHPAGSWVEQVLVAKDGAALAAADENAAQHGGDAADRLLAIAVVERPPASVVGGQAGAADLRGPRVPARPEGEEAAAGERDRAGRVVERPHAPIAGVDQLQTGRLVQLLLMPMAVDRGLIVDTGHGQAAVAQPEGSALRALHRLGLGLGLEPVAEPTKEGDRLGQLVVTHRQAAEVDLGDRGAGLDDEGPPGGRVEGQAGVPLVGDEAVAAPGALPAGADLVEPRYPHVPVGRDQEQARGADRVLRPEDEDEAAAVGGAGLEGALQVAAPEDAAGVGVDGADERVAEPAAAGRDDRRHHARAAGPGGSEDEAV